jgi:transglutaminase/protease-like cytokinesis protein 3
VFNWLFFNHHIPSSTIIKSTFTLYKKVSEQYANQDVLDYVRKLVPEYIITKPVIDGGGGGEPLKPLLQWFKKDFMRWTPKDPKCEKCNSSGISMSLKLANDNLWKLRKIETYTCNICGSKQVFPRYGDILKIAETRTGRCSEWSMLFGAILNSLSIQTRIVHDYLDHCWNELLINGEWIHVDSTLEYPFSFNHPHYYEQNWGKKYSYVLAFSYNGLEDVTHRYTQQWDIVQQRRGIKNNTSKIEQEFARIYSDI